jgi:predicted RNase H-like nuclease
VDIPIGLKGQDSKERLCDKQARAVLSPKKKPCVFRAPSRCAINAITYSEAHALNLACTGKGLSQQCFGIVPKIREMDIFLRAEPQRQKVREMHPEVAFWALNHRQSMLFSKKKAEGFEERMAILCQHLPSAERLVESALKKYLRKEVARDDIVDALVGAVLARQFDKLQRFPETPEMDDTGVIMEIVYWEPDE